MPPASTESKTVIYIAGLIDLFGVALFGALYLPIIKPLGGGPLELGYLGAVYGFMQLVAGPIVGRMADTHGSKRTLLFCEVVVFLSYVLFASATSLNQVLVARTIAGTFEQVQPLLLARLSRAGGGEREIGLCVAIASMAFIFGPLVGAYLFDGFGPRALLATTASCILFNSTLLYLTVPSDPPRRAEPKKEAASEGGGLVDLVTRDFLQVGRMCSKSPLFFRLLLIRFAAFSGIAFQVLVNGQHLETRFALPVTSIGSVFAIVSVAGTVGGAFTGWMVSIFGSTERALRFALFVHAFGFLCSFLSPSLLGFVALQAAFAFSNTLCIALGTKFVMDEGAAVLVSSPTAADAKDSKAAPKGEAKESAKADEESTAGTVMGCAQVAFALVQLIAPPLSGALAESRLGPISSPLFASGILILAAFVGILPLTRGHLKAQ